MSTHEFDDIIKQKAQRRQADVPPDIWEGIANNQKKRRKSFFWLLFLALFIGSGVAVWKINNSNSDSDAVAVEKTTADKNNDAVEKREPVSDETNSGQSSSENKIKNSDAHGGAETTTQPINNLNTSKNIFAEKRKAVVPISKQQRMQNAVAANTGKKILLQKKYKRNTKGKYNVTIQNAGLDELAERRNAKNVIVKDESKTEQPHKNYSIDLPAAIAASVDNGIAPITDSSKTNTTVIASSKPVEPKSTTQADKSDVDKKETTSQKITDKQKNTNLKIEARATLLFPLQQYEQPQTIQRILNTPINSASFASDKKILSTIESGNAFSITLVKKVNNKWSIGAGISYQRFTERLQLPGNETNTEYSIVLRLKEGPNGPYIGPDTVQNSSTYTTTLFGRNIYKNTGVPLFARYRFINGKKLSCEFTTGLTLNLLRKYENNIPGEFITVYDDGSKQTGIKNSIGIDAFAGLLVSGRLYSRCEWFAASEYSYNLSAYKNIANKKINMPKVSVGVLYELRKK